MDERVSLNGPRAEASEADDGLRTLGHWRRLAAIPCTIECGEMHLLGRDHEGAIFSGPGRIEIDRDTQIRFYVYGNAEDGITAFRKYKAAKDSPYDVHEQFRLRATDYLGNDWHGGWTNADFFTDHKYGWPLTGELRGLSTDVSGVWVSKTSSVELLLIPPEWLPMSEAMVSTSSIGPEEVQMRRRPGRQVIEVLNTKVIFTNEPADDALWITARTSSELDHPFAERWLCEPLRILMGAPIYPRLTARNFGGGKAMVTLLPAPSTRRPSAFALMHPLTKGAQFADFWKLYADILTMIARTSTLEDHEITRFYEELSQAQRGSRWVILLTLASTIEALAKSLMSDADRRSEFPDDVLDSMEKHINCWQGDSAIRARVLTSLGQMRERSVLAFLRTLAAKGVLPDHCDTWRKLRNSVMHGQLVEPWRTEEGDAHLREMMWDPLESTCRHASLSIL